MNDDFPTYGASAKKGELGVLVVTRLIFEEFRWIFRRTPQEYDFGIDGHIDLVNSDKGVTGQQFAVQIKCGDSFFKETNEWGFVYRGDKKHLSYLQNHAMPVLILLVDSNTQDVYWAKFDLRSVEETDKHWKMTVPSANLLSSDKERIEKLMPTIENPREKIEQYRQFREAAIGSDGIFFSVEHWAILEGNVSGARELFDRLRARQDTALDAAQKVSLTFDGYDADERALWDIPEFREYVKILDKALPELIFFASTEASFATLLTVARCLTDVKTGERTGDQVEVFQDNRQIGKFVDDRIAAFTELNHWTNRDFQECKDHYRLILEGLGLLQDLTDEKIEELISGNSNN